LSRSSPVSWVDVSAVCQGDIYDVEVNLSEHR
jgi:hypothetical protein